MCINLVWFDVWNNVFWCVLVWIAFYVKTLSFSHTIYLKNNIDNYLGIITTPFQRSLLWPLCLAPHTFSFPAFALPYLTLLSPIVKNTHFQSTSPMEITSPVAFKILTCGVWVKIKKNWSVRNTDHRVLVCQLLLEKRTSLVSEYYYARARLSYFEGFLSLKTFLGIREINNLL